MSYKIPSKIFLIDAIPYKQNQKIDYLQLHSYLGVEKNNKFSAIAQAPNYSDNLKNEILDLYVCWANLLGLRMELLHPKFNFLESGGDSLKVVELGLFFEKKFNIKFDYEGFYNQPTLGYLQKLMEEK